MNPELAHFFGSMESYFADPSTQDRLFAAHPGWDAAKERCAIYGRFVLDHVQAILDKLYPLSRHAMGEALWKTLSAEFYALRPSRHYELNTNGEAFCALVSDRAAALGLPPFLPQLARFEWLDFAVYASMEEVPAKVDRLTPNPTLTALELGHQLCAWIAAGEGRPQAPEPGAEVALLWRHPLTQRTFFRKADPQALMVIKLAVEAIPLEAAAAQTGIERGELERLVGHFAADGMLLSPG